MLSMIFVIIGFIGHCWVDFRFKKRKKKKNKTSYSHSSNNHNTSPSNHLSLKQINMQQDDDDYKRKQSHYNPNLFIANNDKNKGKPHAQNDNNVSVGTFNDAYDSRNRDISTVIPHTAKHHNLKYVKKFKINHGKTVDSVKLSSNRLCSQILYTNYYVTCLLSTFIWLVYYWRLKIFQTNDYDNEYNDNGTYSANFKEFQLDLDQSRLLGALSFVWIIISLSMLSFHDYRICLQFSPKMQRLAKYFVLIVGVIGAFSILVILGYGGYNHYNISLFPNNIRLYDYGLIAMIIALFVILEITVLSKLALVLHVIMIGLLIAIFKFGWIINPNAYDTTTYIFWLCLVYIMLSIFFVYVLSFRISMRAHAPAFFASFLGLLDLMTDVNVILIWMLGGNYFWASIQIFIIMYSQTFASLRLSQGLKNDKHYFAMFLVFIGLGRFYYGVRPWNTEKHFVRFNLLKIWEMVRVVFFEHVTHEYISVLCVTFLLKSCANFWELVLVPLKCNHY